MSIHAVPEALSSADPDGILGPGHPIDLPYGLTVGSATLIEVLAVVVVAALWFLVFGAVLNATRPGDVKPLPATADFPGDEPPAVVSLLANRWRLNEDAAESTLIDLAARDWIELRQPGNDPGQTTVHLRSHPGGRPAAERAPLTAYEEMVLARVRAEAVDDIVPITALTFRDLGQARSWTHTLNQAVMADARARGLTRRRFSPVLVSLLSSAALVPAALLALVIMDRSGEVGAGPGAGLVTWGVLSGLAGRPLGERDTPLGREVAARWLGLRTFLRNDEVFAELPPAAVAVWDRYLSYGDALGVTRVCSALIDLGMGNRKRVWSSFGGRWHRVRVRYPTFWGRYGATAPRVLIGALAVVAIGVLMLKAFGLQGFSRPDSAGRALGDLPLVLGLYLVVRGVYRLLRLAADLLAPRTLTGEVLWVELWKQTAASEDKPARPLVHYFAVDDGTSDRTTAWALPSDWSDQARPGDVVTVVVRPWTRRVSSLSVDVSRAARLVEPVPAPASVPTPAPVSARPRTEGGPGSLPMVAAVTTPVGPSLAFLLTVDEVTAALGCPVLSDGASARMKVGPFELVTFTSPNSGKPVLVVAVARGAAVALVIRGVRRGGAPLPGIGDEAWSGPDWVLGRRGETMVRINREPGTGSSDPGSAAEVLPGLLTTALSRLA